MKSKKFFLIFIFGLFIFLLPNFVEAACKMGCCRCGSDYCAWRSDPGLVDYPVALCERIGLTGSVPNYEACTPANCDNALFKCSNISGTAKCGCGYFVAGSNGQSCTAKDRSWDWFQCTDCVKSGVWDTSDAKCVTCNGKREGDVWGNTSAIADTCNNSPFAGDGQCESACGAPSACDEKYGHDTNGDLCGTGKRCNSNCQCVTIGCAIGGVTYNNGDYNPSNKCQVCDSSKSTTAWSNVADGTDPANWCSLSWNSCDGKCIRRGGDGNCYSGTCDVTHRTGNIASGYICTGSGTQTAVSSSNYCNYDENCDAGDCSATKWYTSCNGSGSCRAASDHTASYSENVTASAGKVLKSDCSERSPSTSYYCDYYENCSNGDCSADEYYRACDGSGSCRTNNTDAYHVDVYASAGYSLTSSCGTTGSTLCDSTWRASSGTGDNHYGKGGAYTCQGMCDGSGKCEYAINCGVCAGTLNVSISGAGTCTVTASLTATLCNGKFWQVRDDGTTKCSGTVSGSPYSYTCSSWTVGVGSYVYSLYIDGVKKDSKSVTCSATPNEPPTCNYLDASPNSGNAPLTVSFTGSGSDSDGNIVEYQLDFDGDGTWDYTGSVSPPEPNPVVGYNHTYTTPDTYTAKIRFKDDDGVWSSVPSVCTQVISVTEPGVVINPPVVTTNEANPVETTSATLNGILVDLGYDPATCPSCSCIVWFEWGTTTSYGNSTPVQTMTSTGNFSANISGLSPNTTYYFEAFAKNGGSW